MKCLNCVKETKNPKYCSRLCTKNHHKKHKIGAFFNKKIQIENAKNNKINCRCAFFDKAIQSKAGKIGGKRNVENNRKNKTGIFSIKSQIKSQNTNRKNKTGMCFDKNIQSKAGKIGGKLGYIVCRKNKIGIFNPDLKNSINFKNGIKKAMRKMIKNKTGFYSVEIRRKAIETNRKNKTNACFNPIINYNTRLNISKNRGTYVFNNIYFDSKGEMEFALNIHYQIEKLKLWQNYQFIIGLKRIDFYIKKYDCFIEYHPYDRNLNMIQYYINRLKVINNGGYKDSNLLIIK